MQLDINPNWPDFVSYNPPAGALAAPSNGRKLLSSTAQGPSTFFEAWWARDFITMSARPSANAQQALGEVRRQRHAWTPSGPPLAGSATLTRTVQVEPLVSSAGVSRRGR